MKRKCEGSHRKHGKYFDHRLICFYSCKFDHWFIHPEYIKAQELQACEQQTSGCCFFPSPSLCVHETFPLHLPVKHGEKKITVHYCEFGQLPPRSYRG